MEGQLEFTKEQLQLANESVSSLTIQVGELTERIKSLEGMLVQKGVVIDKAQRQNKALGKLVSGKKSERQESSPGDGMSQEEFYKRRKEQTERRKERKNGTVLSAIFTWRLARTCLEAFAEVLWVRKSAVVCHLVYRLSIVLQ